MGQRERHHAVRGAAPGPLTPWGPAGYASGVSRVLSSIVLFVVGIVLASFACEPLHPAGQLALLAAGTSAFVCAFRPRIGIGLLLGSFFALAGTPAVLDALSHFTFSFWALGTVGGFLLAAPRGFRSSSQASGLGLLLASLPSWALGEVSGGFMGLALVLVFAGLFQISLRPLISGLQGEPVAPRAAPPPAPVEVAPRTYGFTRGVRVLRAGIWLGALAALVGIALSRSTPSEVWLTVVITGLVLSGTWALCLWLNDRMQFRVDGEGLHARKLFAETTIPWGEVAALDQVEAYITFGARYRYWRVFAPGRMIAFPDILVGSAELRATIEAASGLRWDR